MRIIEPNAWEVERKAYVSELIHQYPYSFYKEQERNYLKRLYHILFRIKEENDLLDIKLEMNPYLKLVTVPFVFEHPVENKLRGPVFRDVVLIPTFFSTGDFLVHKQELKTESDFFKVLNGLHRSFTMRSLINELKQKLNYNDVGFVEKRVVQIVKKMIYEQLVVMS